MRKQISTGRLVGLVMVGVVAFKATNTMLLGFSFDPMITGLHVFLAAVGLVLIWRN